jgi:1-deoxy-D-xylulose-5-phosphate synthase
VIDVEVAELESARPLASLTPARVRACTDAELADLAAELRRFLVASVAKTGGHLGANLGVVELTLALHRVFDSPRDALIWDTGHQAYVHKALTGRAGRFDTLRQAGGLSGYPSRAESPHDVVENSHASTALSYAAGLAAARRLAGAPGRVVAVVGDGALTGGVAYEALNNLGVHGEDVLVVLNDNGRSYAPTVSRLAEPGAAARFFTSLGLDYVGTVDGHDLTALDAALRDASARRGPLVVHVRTCKGRGYRPAEADEDRCLHDVGRFDPATGRSASPAPPSYTDVFGDAILAAGARDPSIVAITAAMGSPTGLTRFAARFPDRFFDVGIAEQHAVNVAAGMAMGGLRPVVAIYSTFLNRAWDQLYYDVGLHGLPVVLCVDRAGVTGDDGPSHHGTLDLALLPRIPGMTVLAPSSGPELAAMLDHALRLVDGPVAIRWPKGPVPPVADGVGSGLGARCVRRGRDLCLVGVGRLVAACREAAVLLEGAGVDATVWDARAVTPIDPALLADVRRHAVVLTAEDGIVDGGFGWRLRDALATSPPAVTTCGLPTRYLAHGPASEILTSLRLDGPGLAGRALDALAAVAA